MNGGLARFKTFWGNARTSLWFVPAVLGAAVTILAFLLLEVDRSFQGYISQNLPFLFGGTASAARSVLSTIAASTITVISIAFSLTVIAIQQASVQFTPRVLRTFTSDRGNQWVLGVYVATFLYSLLILRAVRDPSDDGTGAFVPSVATTIAILLVVICIGLLIYFINHIATSLQATTVISRVHHELLEQIDKLYPERMGKESKVPEEGAGDRPIDTNKGSPIRSSLGGFVVRIEEDALKSLDTDGGARLFVFPKVGDFVVQNEVIARLQGDCDSFEELQKEVQAAIVIENQRSMTQDPMFAIRQLVDIALKGLSPGINDPTTADYCIRYLGDALCLLAQREFPSSVRTFENGKAELHLNKPTWDEFVLGAYVQVQDNSSGNVQVTEVLLRTLHKLAGFLPDAERAAPVRLLLRQTRYQLDEEAELSESKKRHLYSSIDSVEKALPSK